MSDLQIVIAFLSGMLFGYLIGRSRRATEFDLLRLELFEVKNRLDVIRRIEGDTNATV